MFLRSVSEREAKKTVRLVTCIVKKEWDGGWGGKMSLFIGRVTQIKYVTFQEVFQFLKEHPSSFRKIGHCL